jgi:hypothetical protein
MTKATLAAFTLALALSGTTALQTNGATIELANGYKLDGKILARDKDAIRVDSALMGRIDIPLANVAKITEEAPQTAQTATPSPKTDTAPTSTTAESKAPPPPAKGDTDTFLERLNFLDNWKTNIALGMGYVNGTKDSANTSITFDTERKWTKQELRFELLQQYEELTDSDGEKNVSKDMLKTVGRYRHNLGERFFWQSETQYGYDNVREIDLDIRESLGLGWRAIKSKRINLSLTSAFSAQKLQIEGKSEDLTYSPTLFEEFTFDLTKSTSLRQEFSVLFPVNGDAGNSYHFSIGMKSMLSDHLSFNLLYLFDHDGTVPDDIEPQQTSLNMLLGVSF